jgi:hypothetical protein
MDAYHWFLSTSWVPKLELPMEDFISRWTKIVIVQTLQNLHNKNNGSLLLRFSNLPPLHYPLILIWKGKHYVHFSHQGYMC